MIKFAIASQDSSTLVAKAIGAMEGDGFKSTTIPDAPVLSAEKLTDTALSNWTVRLEADHWIADGDRILEQSADPYGANTYAALFPYSEQNGGATTFQNVTCISAHEFLLSGFAKYADLDGDIAFAWGYLLEGTKYWFNFSGASVGTFTVSGNEGDYPNNDQWTLFTLTDTYAALVPGGNVTAIQADMIIGLRNQGGAVKLGEFHMTDTTTSDDVVLNPVFNDWTSYDKLVSYEDFAFGEGTGSLLEHETVVVKDVGGHSAKLTTGANETPHGFAQSITITGATFKASFWSQMGTGHTRGFFLAGMGQGGGGVGYGLNLSNLLWEELVEGEPDPAMIFTAEDVDDEFLETVFDNMPISPNGEVFMAMMSPAGEGTYSYVATPSEKEYLRPGFTPFIQESDADVSDFINAIDALSGYLMADSEGVAIDPMFPNKIVPLGTWVDPVEKILSFYTELTEFNFEKAVGVANATKPAHALNQYTGKALLGQSGLIDLSGMGDVSGTMNFTLPFGYKLLNPEFTFECLRGNSLNGNYVINITFADNIFLSTTPGVTAAPNQKTVNFSGQPYMTPSADNIAMPCEWELASPDTGTSGIGKVSLFGTLVPIDVLPSLPN